MSSKEEILASIRQHTQTRYEKPDLERMERLVYSDKVAQFCTISRAVGGEAVVLGEGEDLNAIIRQTYPDARRIASVLPEITCATFNPDDLEDPRQDPRRQQIGQPMGMDQGGHHQGHRSRRRPDGDRLPGQLRLFHLGAIGYPARQDTDRRYHVRRIPHTG